jgi:hypothetical protein
MYLLLCIQYLTPDDGQKTCPKHVEFCRKNQFEELVHLVDFIIRIYHDARSSELQNENLISPIIYRLVYIFLQNFVHLDTLV